MHIFVLGLDRADDRSVWDYAQQTGFTVVTRDANFNELSVLRGFPPKVIWILRGNCSTSQYDFLKNYIFRRGLALLNPAQCGSIYHRSNN